MGLEGRIVTTEGGDGVGDDLNWRESGFPLGSFFRQQAVTTTYLGSEAAWWLARQAAFDSSSTGLSSVPSRLDFLLGWLPLRGPEIIIITLTSPRGTMPRGS